MFERHRASAQRQESERLSAKVRAEAEEFYRQAKRGADRAAKERRTMEIDYAALPALTTENRELRDQLSDLRAEFKEMGHQLLACNRSGETLLVEHDSQLKEQQGVHQTKQRDLRYERNLEAWERKQAEDREKEATAALKLKTPPKALEDRPERLEKGGAAAVMKRQELLEEALAEYDALDEDRMDVEEEDGGELLPESVRGFAPVDAGRGKYNPFPPGVQFLAMKLVSKHTASCADSASMYGDILRALPDGYLLPDDAFLKKMYFVQKLKQGRIGCLLANAYDLSRASGHGAVSGDGGSDHVLKRGVCQFFSYHEQITTAEGKKRIVYPDGFLVSGGLTSEAEVEVCMEVKKDMRMVLRRGKELMKKLFPKHCPTAKYLGAEVDESNISLERKRYFVADDAAQKFARLMGAEKLKEIAAKYMHTTEQLNSLTPTERHQLEWFETGNCDMHNVQLAGKWADKAVREITQERTAYAREQLVADGFKSDSFHHSTEVAQMRFTAHKFFSPGQG